jgi:hypothetical protein
MTKLPEILIMFLSFFYFTNCGRTAWEPSVGRRVGGTVQSIQGRKLTTDQPATARWATARDARLHVFPSRAATIVCVPLTSGPSQPTVPVREGNRTGVGIESKQAHHKQKTKGDPVGIITLAGSRGARTSTRPLTDPSHASRGPPAFPIRPSPPDKSRAFRVCRAGTFPPLEGKRKRGRGPNRISWGLGDWVSPKKAAMMMGLGDPPADYSSASAVGLFVLLMCVCIVVGHLLEENQWVNESITALFIVSQSSHHQSRAAALRRCLLLLLSCLIGVNLVEYNSIFCFAGAGYRRGDPGNVQREALAPAGVQRGPLLHLPAPARYI